MWMLLVSRWSLWRSGVLHVFATYSEVCVCVWNTSTSNGPSNLYCSMTAFMQHKKKWPVRLTKHCHLCVSPMAKSAVLGMSSAVLFQRTCRILAKVPEVLTRQLCLFRIYAVRRLQTNRFIWKTMCLHVIVSSADIASWCSDPLCTRLSKSLLLEVCSFSRAIPLYR